MRPPLVFDVARGSEVDGPGLRTTVFLKGCPLRCAWCHNPESQRPGPEIAFFADRCTGGWTCAAACPRDTIELGGDARLRRALCDACGDCVDACDSLAVRRVGRQYSVSELVELILRDSAFYAVSGGGVTFSGGEPLIHACFVGRLARRLKERGLHVAVETCGCYDHARVRAAALPWIDLVLFDLKLVDRAAHRRWTGRGNRRILFNLGKLAAAGRGSGAPELRVRVPLIPGITATEENLEQIAALLRSVGVASWELLSYNPSGLGKWARLGRSAPAGLDPRPMPLAVERRWRRRFARLMEDGCGDGGL